MIKIYGSTSDLKGKYKGFEDIRKIRSYFRMVISTDDFDDTDRMIVKKIDNAEVIGDDLFRTPEGIAYKDQLSSGSIISLIINYWLKNSINDKAIRVTSCGPNALNIIYELVNDTDVVIIQRPMIMDGADTPHEICYNDGEFRGSFEEYEIFLMDLGFKRSTGEVE